MRHATECSKIEDPTERRRVYLEHVDSGKWPDSLRHRMDAQVGLSELEQAALLGLLGKYCRSHTIGKLRFALRCVPSGDRWGIYERVMVRDNGQEWRASYTAGQDYSAEIREVRNLLIKGV